MKTVRFIGFLILVTLVAGSTCFFTGRWMHANNSSSVFNHEYIHDRLNLTPAQKEAFKPIEDRFEQRRTELVQQIQEANRELAQIILEDQTNSTRVAATVQKIHAAQGVLEQVTLSHVFDMKTQLQPAQYQQLLDLTAQALRETSAVH